MACIEVVDIILGAACIEELDRVSSGLSSFCRANSSSSREWTEAPDRATAGSCSCCEAIARIGKVRFDV